MAEQFPRLGRWTPRIGLYIEREFAVWSNPQRSQKSQTTGFVAARRVGLEGQRCWPGRVGVDVRGSPGFLAQQQRFYGFFLVFEENLQGLGLNWQCLGNFRHVFKSPVGRKSVVAPREGLAAQQHQQGKQRQVTECHGSGL